MNREMDRRLFLQATTASAILSVLSNRSAFTDINTSRLALRKKPHAKVRGAFFYPPAEVVLQGEFEDSWSREKWFTWPGNQFEPEAQHKKFLNHLQNITNGLDVDLNLNDKPVYTNAGLESFINEITKTQPDALLLFNFWNTMSAKLDSVLKAYDGPIIVYHPVGSNHQLPPKHFMTAPRVQYIHSIENWAALERGLRSVHTFSRLSNSRLLRISGRTESQKETVESNYGTSIREIPAKEFNDLFDETVVTKEMEDLAKSIREHATHVHDLQPKAFWDAVRSHAAVLNILDRHDADAISIECLFLKHRKPCLSFSINNGDLIPCGCENDLNASLSLMAGVNLFNRGGFQHNPEFDTEENLYFASHCTCATKLHGPKDPQESYWLRPFFHQMPKTLALDVTWPKGEPVTLFKLNRQTQQIDAWLGDVVDSPSCPPTGGCSTRVLVKMRDIKDICSIYPGPHPILYCGDFTRQVKTFADLYAIDIRTNA